MEEVGVGMGRVGYKCDSTSGMVPAESLTLHEGETREVRMRDRIASELFCDRACLLHSNNNRKSRPPQGVLLAQFLGIRYEEGGVFEGFRSGNGRSDQNTYRHFHR